MSDATSAPKRQRAAVIYNPIKVDLDAITSVAAQEEEAVRWVQIFVKVIWENGVLRRTNAGRALMTKEVSALRYVRATELGVRLERAEQIELDGDGFGEALEFHVRVDPGGLTIKFPPSS